MSQANLINELIQFFDEEIAEIQAPTCHWWGAKRSYDNGQSWQKTTRLEHFIQAREVVLQLAPKAEPKPQKSSQSGTSDSSRSRREPDPEPES